MFLIFNSSHFLLWNYHCSDAKVIFKPYCYWKNFTLLDCNPCKNYVFTAHNSNKDYEFQYFNSLASEM